MHFFVRVEWSDEETKVIEKAVKGLKKFLATQR